MNTQRIAGLDTLRAYAAIAVVVWHVATYQPWFGYDYPRDSDLLKRLFISGPDAVLLFFALSGFLITDLLLKERDHSADIDVTPTENALYDYAAGLVFALLVLNVASS